jgi:Cu/Ag efflux protein CusF
MDIPMSSPRFVRRVRGAAAALAALAFAAFTHAAPPMVQGEVRSVDVKAKTVTLKHGEIPNVGMGPMTMSFKVKDPALLAKVKAGDKVKFAAEQSGGEIIVVALEPAK